MEKHLQAKRSTSVLGWHDSHCASAAVVENDGTVIYALSEERLNKRKLYKGYPAQTIEQIRKVFDGLPPQIVYADMPLAQKISRNLSYAWNTRRKRLNSERSLGSLASTILGRFGKGQFSGIVGADEEEIDTIGFNTLSEHHTAHAASAYYCSDQDESYVVTVDGVGDCLSATISIGRDGELTRQHKFYYNESTIGADYETFTAMMGFNPDRHCGKITGLAAYGSHNQACIDAVRNFFASSWKRGQHNYFERMHGPRELQTQNELHVLREKLFGEYSREDLSFAIQHLSEQSVLDLIRERIPNIHGSNVCLAGGVFANVRINQKIKELGFKNIFVQPAMDDGGLALGAALVHLSETTDLRPKRLPNVYLGTQSDDAEIEEELQKSGLTYQKTEHIAHAIARLIQDGNVVARFDGRMEFGPRALGNRSLLYGTSDPKVNDWLNSRLGRTEFMPFAPATMHDQAERCYQGLDGCLYTAEFMTITFDCTDFMKKSSPAVVHVDGTARAQLVSPHTNSDFYEILEEYHKLTGIPSLVNTSFNMHESPIVATAADAIESFQQGRLDYLALGPYLVKQK